MLHSFCVSKSFVLHCHLIFTICFQPESRSFQKVTPTATQLNKAKENQNFVFSTRHHLSVFFLLWEKRLSFLKIVFFSVCLVYPLLQCVTWRKRQNFKNSNFTKQLAINLGIEKQKIKIIFPGINKPEKIEDKFDLKSKNIFQNSFPKIITIARLEKRKGHEKILMSIKKSLVD